MELVNHTAAVSDLQVGRGPRPDMRCALVVAKLTWRFELDGTMTLDTQDPVPVLSEDETTELGVLPRDTLPRIDDALEVMLLGEAHAPSATAVQRRRVSLRVGSVTNAIDVVGDRVWTEGGSMTPPRPFERMPLTYERAFGGTCKVLVDRGAEVPVSDPYNGLGRGFDPTPQAAGLARHIGAPDVYPIARYQRQLPNLEDPRQPIASPTDTPPPHCFGAVPMGIGFSQIRQIRRQLAGEPALSADASLAETFQRAHPDWIIERPEGPVPIEMVGMTPRERVRLELSWGELSFDYAIGERQGSLPLLPQTLVILPAEQRLYVVYRRLFKFRRAPGEHRSLRLRVEGLPS